MRIGIVGNGTVGHATAEALRPHVDEVRCYDSNPARRTHGISEVLESDITFLCLPTPQLPDALGCDTLHVEAFLEVLNSDDCKRNLVLRSTVPVGFTRRMREKHGLVNLVHSPEFLTARTAVEDARNPTRIVIGDPTFRAEPGAYHGTACYTRLLGLYRGVWPGLPFHSMTSDESEFVKLTQNAFSAVKVSLFNEFRAYADRVELDWEGCLAALLAGGWVNPMHTQVPGPDGKRGFGGACLPKDLANLIDCMDRAGVFNIVMSAALDRNRRDRG